MAESSSSTVRPSAFWSALRDPETGPDWRLAATFIAAAAISVALATGLGDVSRAPYTLFPAVLTIAVGVSAGLLPGAVVGAVTALLVSLAVLAGVTPWTAALAFAVVLLWITVPSRIAPSATLAPLFQLAYFIVAAFGPPGTQLVEGLAYSLAGLLAGLAIVTMIWALRRIFPRKQETNSPAEDGATSTPAPAATSERAPTAAEMFGHVLVAAISAALLYWRLEADSQTAAWVLVTFILVLQPTHPATALRSLGRVLGTLVGFGIVMLLSVLPSTLAVALGASAVVPSLAYTKRNYVVSVAATTMMVVTMYGAPTGQYLAWGLMRMLDTAIGAALAIVVSATVRRLDGFQKDINAPAA